jgi:hypothetical protein
LRDNASPAFPYRFGVWFNKFPYCTAPLSGLFLFTISQQNGAWHRFADLLNNLSRCTPDVSKKADMTACKPASPFLNSYLVYNKRFVYNIDGREMADVG